jgi:hypothetical protein
MFLASAYFGPEGGTQFESYPLPSSRIGSSFSRRAPVVINPIVYAELYTIYAAACRVYYIGSPQELPRNMCDTVVPLLVVLYDPRSCSTLTDDMEFSVSSS